MMFPELALDISPVFIDFHDDRMISGSESLIDFFRAGRCRNDQHIFFPFRHRHSDIGRNAEESRNAGNRLRFVFRPLKCAENIHIGAVQHGISQCQENQIFPFIQFFRDDFAIFFPLSFYSRHIRIHLKNHR